MIGLIFGDTNFPKVILKKIKKIKKKYFIIDLTKYKSFKKDKNFILVSVGQIGKIIDILKINKCKKVLFAGKVNKPNFSKLKLDLKGVYYLPRIIKASMLGDVAILKEIINIFKIEKIKTVNSLTFTPELSLPKGIHTKIKPNTQDQEDIRKSISTLLKQNNYNFSQGTVVRDNKVLAVEAKSGTQNMLQKIKKKQNILKGVLVKFPKKKQDLRVDLPTVGLETLLQCKKSGLKGIVLKHKQNVCLDKKQLISFANKNKMFIAVL
jgi:DUF1009 family protein|tara:strand:+ start:522 stop:1316 length:795 start_codon:yes stop_codon:yes gene_type:complete